MTDTDNTRALVALRNAKERGIMFIDRNDQIDTLIAALELVERVRGVAAELKMPRTGDECTLYTVGHRDGRNEAARAIDAALPIDTTGAS